MQKKTWMPLGLAAALLGPALASVLAAGCNSDDSSPSPADASTDLSLRDTAANSNDSGLDVHAMADAGSDGDATLAPDADAAPGPASVAKVYIVHASPDAPPLRFCFGIPLADGGSAVFNFPAAPDAPNRAFPFPGLFPGFGGPLDTRGVDPAVATFDVYAINASAIANQSADGGPDGGAQATCAELLGPQGSGGLVSPSDYFYAGTFHQGMFAHGTTWVVALAGCLPGENSAAALCPTPYSPDAGNVQLLPWMLDKTAVDGGQIGAQFAQASSPWDNLAAAGGAATVAGFVIPGPAVSDASSDALVPTDASDANAAIDASEAGEAASPLDAGDASADAAVEASDGGSAAVDAGTPANNLFRPIAVNARFGDLKPVPLIGVSGVTYDGTSAFLAQAITADGGTIGIRSVWPLVPTPAQPASIETLTWGANIPDGAAFANGNRFVFVLVGNPGERSPIVDPYDGGPSAPDAGGVFNGHFPHFLAFPTN